MTPRARATTRSRTERPRARTACIIRTQPGPASLRGSSRQPCASSTRDGTRRSLRSRSRIATVRRCLSARDGSFRRCLRWSPWSRSQRSSVPRRRGRHPALSGDEDGPARWRLRTQVIRRRVRRRGCRARLRLVSAATAGCPATGVGKVYSSGKKFKNNTCPKVVREQDQMIDMYQPALVIWWSRYELAPGSGRTGRSCPSAPERAGGRSRPRSRSERAH